MPELLDTADNFLLLTTSAGIALIVLGIGWLIVCSVMAPKGRHTLTPHRGWEGREDELVRFTAAFLIAKHATHTEPRWPSVDVDAFGGAA